MRVVAPPLKIEALEATPPPALFCFGVAGLTLTQPSPLEGEGERLRALATRSPPR